MDFAFKWGDEGTTGWWLPYPSEKSEFVSCSPYSQYMESHKIENGHRNSGIFHKKW
jgi:hypothetical protein